jgi:hypothetical protein
MQILEMVNKNALWYFYLFFYVIILTHAKKNKIMHHTPTFTILENTHNKYTQLICKNQILASKSTLIVLLNRMRLPKWNQML